MSAAGDLNWVGLTFDAVLLFVLLALSASFSGSEAVLFSLTRTQLQHDAASPSRFRRRAAQLMRNPKRTLLMILLGNTAVNTLIFATSFVLFEQLARNFGAWITPVSAVLSVLLVVACGEVVPKVLAVTLTERLTPLAGGFIHVCGYVLGPLGALLDRVLVEPTTRLLFGRTARGPAPEHDISTDELKTLLEMSRRQGVINLAEDTFLREVIDLGHLRVRDVMVPRVEIQAYDLNAPPDGLRELMRKTRRKKIPVYDGDIDNIVGLVYAKVLFLAPDAPLKDLVMPVRFVPEVATGEQLLHHFRNTRTQLAVVVDEYGGIAGLVTLEDVLEEIVGEIHDPEERLATPEIVRLSDTEYEISGKLGVHYWAETFGLPRLSERIATVGGLVAARLGRPPRVADVVRLVNVELKITSVHRRRAERLRLRLLTPVGGNGEGP